MWTDYLRVFDYDLDFLPDSCVWTELMVENFFAPVQRIVIAKALVDQSAKGLGLPKRIISRLGLAPFGERRVRTLDGDRTMPTFGPVRLTILERSMTIDAVELSDELPVIVGHIPLTMFDLIVDPHTRTLIGNPAHGGEHMLEMY